MNIRFYEPTHKYFCLEEPDKPFTSVSKLFDLVKQKFDSENIAKAYSLKGKKEIIQDLAGKWNLTIDKANEKWGHLEFTPEEIIAIWEEKKNIGLARGTKWHKDIEQKLLNRGGKRGTQIEGDYTIPISLKDLSPGHYIELIIPYLPLWLIGTADRVEILPNKEFKIRDWKTDRELSYKGVAYYNKVSRKKEVKKLLHPLSHLDDVNGIHYNVKESLYIYFLESYGYKFVEGWIDHVQFDENNEPIGIVEYPIEYLKSEIKSLLTWYKNKFKC